MRLKLQKAAECRSWDLSLLKERGFAGLLSEDLCFGKGLRQEAELF